MRQVYSSPRGENVDRVEAMLNEAGVATRVVNRDKLNRGRFQKFSYREPGRNQDWPAVQVVSAEDMPKARELLRAAGLMGTTRPDAEPASPRWEAPGNVPDDMARRMRHVAMIAVFIALIVLAWAYRTAPSRTGPIAPQPSAQSPAAAAAPVEDNTVLLLDDSDSDTEPREER
jgi:hypothetical protein